MSIVGSQLYNKKSETRRCVNCDVYAIKLQTSATAYTEAMKQTRLKIRKTQQPAIILMISQAGKERITECNLCKQRTVRGVSNQCEEHVVSMERTRSLHHLTTTTVAHRQKVASSVQYSLIQFC